MDKTKSLLRCIIATAVMQAPFAGISAQEAAREHRAIYMTPYLSNNWPSAAITEANADALKNILSKRLDKFKDQNINVLYYHVRTMCDAMYESSYEPWSSTVSGTRGKAPAFDPFALLIQEAHARGIEVYGWVNPYRYCGVNKWGAGELNYENSHPDWLIMQDNECILNPGLPEVQQRIVDVVTEIVTKYDVDGLIFDDYFYTNGTPLELDADLYGKYTAAGGTMSQNDWRRDNVNTMVRRVSQAIKEAKPYCVFGISPAGVCNPPTVTSEYGLPAGVGSDWQYNGIASDPLNWLKNGYVDFMAPQIYWATTSTFMPLTTWWNMAVQRFGRHMYLATSLTDISKLKQDEYVKQVEFMRQTVRQDEGGIGFFHYGNFVNYYERYFGTNQSFGENMQQTVFPYKALTPLRPWNNKTEPKMTANVKTDGNTLSWDKVDGVRYTVYAVPEDMPDGQFRCQREYLDGISYTNSYTIPDDKKDGYRWGVAVYDRYGNEYSPLMQDAVPTVSTAPTLTYPAEGSNPVDLFDFKWSGTSAHYVLEVAKDADFATTIAAIETSEPSVSVSRIPVLTSGRTYYWRVRASSANALDATSATGSFIASRITVTTPADGAEEVSLTPTLSWTPAAEGCSYTVDISRVSDFSTIIYSGTTDQTSMAIPDHTLVSGRTFYARVTATKGEASSLSEAVAFTTIDKDDYAAPEFINPASDNITLHSNDMIEVKPWNGLNSVIIYISASNTFPARTSYTGTLSNFATTSPSLENIKISGKNLADGNTYYLRARGSYYLSDATAVQYTGYTPTYTFIYSAEAGIHDTEADTDGLSFIDSEGMLHIEEGAVSVEIYSVSGRLLATVDNTSSAFDMNVFQPGAYIVRILGKHSPRSIKWVK